MKAFNLRTISSFILATVFSISFGQEVLKIDNEKEEFLYEDSQFYNALFDEYDISYKTERREIDYLNALHKIDDIMICYADLGFTAIYSSGGDFKGYHVWEVKCNNTLDYAEMGIPERPLFCNQNEINSGYKLINYGAMYFEMKSHADYLSRKYEVEAYNKGLAWRGPYAGRANGSKMNSTSNHGGKVISQPSRRNGGSKQNFTPKRTFNSNSSGGSDPYSRSTPTRLGHSLSK